MFFIFFNWPLLATGLDLLGHHLNNGFYARLYCISVFISWASRIWIVVPGPQTLFSKSWENNSNCCKNGGGGGRGVTRNRILKSQGDMNPLSPVEIRPLPSPDNQLLCKLWKWSLVRRHISSSLPCPSVFSPPSLSLYSCLDRGALGNQRDRRWGPQIEDPIVVQREMHCGWICPVLCKSNTLFTWTNTSCGVSPLLPCAAFFP